MRIAGNLINRLFINRRKYRKEPPKFVQLKQIVKRNSYIVIDFEYPAVRYHIKLSVQRSLFTRDIVN